MKILIPAQTVHVDPEAWAIEYGIDPKDVRESVKQHFEHVLQTQIDLMGLNPARPAE